MAGQEPKTTTIQQQSTSRTLWRRINTAKERDLESSPVKNEEDEAALERPLRDFLSAISGKPVLDDVPFTIQQSAYINFVEEQIVKNPISSLADILHGPNKDGLVEIDSSEVFVLLTSIARSARKGSQFSIESALKQAVEDKILHEATLDGPLHRRASSISFSCVAWVSMLYPPVSPALPPYENLAIEKTECLCIEDTQPISNLNIPVCEVIQGFGPLLPVRRDIVIPNTSDSVFSAESLYVSLLNASTLTQIGRIEIEWVSNVSSHLGFDPEIPKLMLFAHPSFCRINEDQSSTFAKIVSSYYDGFSMPQNFSGANFLKELRRSYHLIFSDDTRSANHYRHKERRKLQIKGRIDPYLDILAECVGEEQASNEILTVKSRTFRYSQHACQSSKSI